MSIGGRAVSEQMLWRIGPRALAVLLRRLSLPLIKWLQEGEYAPFATAFSHMCDAAEAWSGLGHDPRTVPSLELDALDRRGSSAERQVWGILWSTARAMERARSGVGGARSQFLHTLNMIDELYPPEELGAVSRALQDQVAAAVAHVAETVEDSGDPPLDVDSLEVPRFWKGDPQGVIDAGRASASREIVGTEGRLGERVFDNEVNDLIKAVRAGRVAVFFGAGISIASGIPSAAELRRALLKKLPASEREAQWLESSDLPFEAFMETIHLTTGLAPLLAVFANGSPGPAHHLLARLVERGLVTTMATTNFDEHLDEALRERGVAHRTVWRAGDFEHEGLTTTPASLFKLHGTVSDAESVALTMEQVAGRRQIEGRIRVVGSMFGDGPHDAVLVIGYSCSDLFDVSPHIEALGSGIKPVHVVDHAMNTARAEDVWLKRRRNPFGDCRGGARLICDTDALLARLARDVGIGELPAANPAASTDWQQFVDRWWDDVPARERTRAGHEILGILMYRCGDYRAAKSHLRIALAAAGPRSRVEVRSSMLLRIAGCHRALSEYNLAQDIVQQASLLTINVRRREVADDGTAMDRGNILFNTGKIAEALSWYERDLERHRDEGRRDRALGTSLANLGNAYGALGRLDEALACFEEALEIARETGDKTAEGSRLGGIGQVYWRLERFADAEVVHLKSLAIAEAMGDPVGVAMQRGSLATVHAAQGRLDEAIEEGQSAAALFHDLGDSQGEARVLGNLGGDCLHAGRAEAAIHCFVRSLEIAAVIGEGTVLKSAVANLSQFLRVCAALGVPLAMVTNARTKLEAVRSETAGDVSGLLRAFLALLPYCADLAPDFQHDQGKGWSTK